MMQKFGVNNTRVQKDIKTATKTEKILRCRCGKKFAASCPDNACSIKIFTCPHCGAELQ